MESISSKLGDGLLIMRGQPVHYGHIRLVDYALARCRHLYIVLGSVQEKGTSRNPFPFSDRQKMLRNYYSAFWDSISVIGLSDINDPDWPNYVFREIEKEFPDHNIKYIFGGSQYDCNWFPKLTPHIVDRSDIDYPFVSASMIRDMLTYKDKRWMTYVPECNYRLIAKKFNRLDML